MPDHDELRQVLRLVTRDIRSAVEGLKRAMPDVMEANDIGTFGGVLAKLSEADRDICRSFHFHADARPQPTPQAALDTRPPMTEALDSIDSAIRLLGTTQTFFVGKQPMFLIRELTDAASHLAQASLAVANFASGHGRS